MIRRLSAQYIFSVHDVPSKRAVVSIDENHYITAISATEKKIDTIERLEFYDGILIPALIPYPDGNLKDQWSELITLTGHRRRISYHIIALYLLREIKRKQKNAHFEELLENYTLESSKALHLDRLLGTLEPGKKPGVLHIRNFDFKSMKLTEESSCEILLLPEFDIPVL